MLQVDLFYSLNRGNLIVFRLRNNKLITGLGGTTKVSGLKVY